MVEQSHPDIDRYHVPASASCIVAIICKHLTVASRLRVARQSSTETVPKRAGAGIDVVPIVLDASSS